MDKSEYRKFIESKYNGSGYYYVKQKDKDLEMRVHDLLVDIMTIEASAKRLIAMFPGNYGLPNHCLGEHELLKLESFESLTVHSDILDDGEFHIIHDIETDSWFFDRTYDFLEYAEDIFKCLGIKTENAEIGSVNGWRRNNYKIGITFGLEDVATVLECVKSGDFSQLRSKLPLESAEKRLEYWHSH